MCMLILLGNDDYLDKNIRFGLEGLSTKVPRYLGSHISIDKEAS